MITEAQRRALFALREALHLCRESEVLLYAHESKVRVCATSRPELSFALKSRFSWLDEYGIDRLLAEHPEPQ